VDAPVAQHLMSLDLLVDDALVVPAIVRRRLRVEVARMVRAAARHDRRADYEVAVRLVGDLAIHALNRDYRHKNKPTDVLAFAQREGSSGRLHPGVLGDIVISIPTARRQARAAKCSLSDRVTELLAHGLLHLLGHDHRNEGELRRMRARTDLLCVAAAGDRRRGRK